MSSRLQQLCAFLLGACLCIAAALSMPRTVAAQAQWAAAYAQSDVPSDSQPLGSVSCDADDADDYDDVLTHVALGLSCLDFGTVAQTRTLSPAREHVRREDRRCDKPPRASQV